jgi:hypothetical protein
MQNSAIKKIIGIALIIIGLAALVTPLTPGSWLIFRWLGTYWASYFGLG